MYNNIQVLTQKGAARMWPRLIFSIKHHLRISCLSDLVSVLRGTWHPTRWGVMQFLRICKCFLQANTAQISDLKGSAKTRVLCCRLFLFLWISCSQLFSKLWEASHWLHATHAGLWTPFKFTDRFIQSVILTLQRQVKILVSLWKSFRKRIMLKLDFTESHNLQTTQKGWNCTYQQFCGRHS